MARFIAVLGGGISGYGSAILAKKQGFEVLLSDMGQIAPSHIYRIIKNFLRRSVRLRDKSVLT